MTTAPAWVRVNECKVFATRRGANWWVLYRMRQPDERITVITQSIAGDLVDVECDSREDADMLRSLMTEHGIPATALTIHTRSPK